MLKILDEACKPTRGTKYSACVDLYAREDVVIGAGETGKVPLGVCIDLEKLFHANAFLYFNEEFNALLFTKNAKTKMYHLSKKKIDKFMRSHYLQLEPRSSLRAKGLQAGTGIIDLDYKNELMIILHNPTNTGIEVNKSCFDEWGTFTIKKGERIAQIMLCEHKSYLFGIESDNERSGGFGSTGVI